MSWWERIRLLSTRTEPNHQRDGPTAVSVRVFGPEKKNETCIGATMLDVHNESDVVQRVRDSNFDLVSFHHCDDNNPAKCLKFDPTKHKLVIRERQVDGVFPHIMATYRHHSLVNDPKWKWWAYDIDISVISSTR